MKRSLLLIAFVLLWSHAAFAQSAKARTFNGSSDNLQSAATVDLTSTTQISISFWLYWNTFANDDSLAFESSSNYNSNAGAFIIDPNDSSGFFQFSVYQPGYFGCHITRPSAAAWHHYLLTLDITTVNAGTCTAYVDGVNATPTIDINAGAGTLTFGNYTLNMMSRNAASLFGAGRMSDIAIWKSILTSGNAASLAACTSPSLIGSVAFYWPINQTSPEVATTGGVNLTVTGTTNSSASCTAASAPPNGLMLMGVGK